MDVALVVLCAGDSTRFAKEVKKQWLYLNDKPLWLVCATNLAESFEFKKVVIVGKNARYMSKFATHLGGVEAEFVEGGESRTQSLKNALKRVENEFVLVSDCARVGVSKALVRRVLSPFCKERGGEDFGAAEAVNFGVKTQCVVPFLSVSDTAVLGENFVQREGLKRVQTPQLSCTAALKEALEMGDFSDESSALSALYFAKTKFENACGEKTGKNGGQNAAQTPQEDEKTAKNSLLTESNSVFANSQGILAPLGENIAFVKGEAAAEKITFAEDLARFSLPAAAKDVFVGSGFDVHQFETGEFVVLGGVQIPHTHGLKAHSDGDAVIHALIDALLGASGLGDVGELFPDTDEKFFKISSLLLLKEVVKLVKSVGLRVINADITLICERPKVSPFKEQIARVLARELGVAPVRVGVKATTTEKLGFTGRGEGLAALANVSLGLLNWQDFTTN